MWTQESRWCRNAPTASPESRAHTTHTCLGPPESPGVCPVLGKAPGRKLAYTEPAPYPRCQGLGWALPAMATQWSPVFASPKHTEGG